MPGHTLTELATFAGAQCVALDRQTPEALALILEELKLCERLGQVVDFPGGFVAWLRLELRHVELFARRDLAGVTRLPAAELRAGPVLAVVEVLATVPGSAYSVVRTLGRLRGVEWVIGYRWDGRLRVHRVRATDALAPRCDRGGCRHRGYGGR